MDEKQEDVGTSTDEKVTSLHTKASQAIIEQLQLVERQLSEVDKDPTITEDERFKRREPLVKKRATLTIERDRALKRETKKAEPDAAGLSEASEEIREAIRFLLQEHDLHYVSTADKFLEFNAETGDWHVIKPSALKTTFPDMFDDVYYRIFLNVLHEEGRGFYSTTFSFNSQHLSVLNLLRPNFLPSIAGRHHEAFDLLMRSLGGDKQENIDHIEQLIIFKYNHPENFLHPHLVMQDHGGTGKSLLTGKVLRPMYGVKLVANNVSMTAFCSKFNQHLAGKLLVFINEAAEDKTDGALLKQILGSETCWFEQKMMPKIECEVFALVIISSNDTVNGSVRLADNDTDRRYSIVCGDRPLRAYVAEYLGVTEEAASDVIEEDWQHNVYSNHEEIGKWLHHLNQKWGHLTSIRGLHGEDYQRVIEQQKQFYNIFFDQLFTHPEFRYIKLKTLYLFYCWANSENGTRRYQVKRQAFNTHLHNWIRKHQDVVEEKKANWVGPADSRRTTADVVQSMKNPGTIHGDLPDNDRDFFTKTERDIEWTFNLE